MAPFRNPRSQPAETGMLAIALNPRRRRYILYFQSRLRLPSWTSRVREQASPGTVRTPEIPKLTGLSFETPAYYELGDVWDGAPRAHLLLPKGAGALETVSKLSQNPRGFGLLGLTSSEKQIPQVVGNSESRTKRMEPLEGRLPLVRQTL
jgi:hypothetical protein